jgi:quinol monooxygenase YgiN
VKAITLTSATAKALLTWPIWKTVPDRVLPLVAISCGTDVVRATGRAQFASPSVIFRTPCPLGTAIAIPSVLVVRIGSSSSVETARSSGYRQRMREPMKGTFGLVVRFELLDGREEAFDDLTAAILQAIRASEPGTLAYLVHRDGSNPAVRVFYELYENETAFETHETQPHVRRFLNERSHHLRSEPEVWPVVPMDGVLRQESDIGGR